MQIAGVLHVKKILILSFNKNFLVYVTRLNFFQSKLILYKVWQLDSNLWL